MFPIRLLAGLLALAVTAECCAQTAPQPLADPALNRSVELMVRSKFNVPEDYDIAIGARTPNVLPGYDGLAVTLSREDKKTAIQFLISTDDKTLARMETFDLTKNPVLSIDVAGRPIRGNSAAKVTVINFDDLECPVCARMNQVLFPAALDRYKDKVRFIYKDNPLLGLHPWAMHAAVDANCLAVQNGEAYWSYVDYLHTPGQEVTGEDRNLQTGFAALDRIARKEAVTAKLDPAKLDACLARQDETQVRASMKEAESLGLNFAPALFVNGDLIRGYISPEAVWMVIDRALRAADAEAAATASKPTTP